MKVTRRTLFSMFAGLFAGAFLKAQAAPVVVTEPKSSFCIKDGVWQQARLVIMSNVSADTIHWECSIDGKTFAAMAPVRKEPSADWMEDAAMGDEPR